MRKGQKGSPEQCAEISAALKGRKRTAVSGTSPTRRLR